MHLCCMHVQPILKLILSPWSDFVYESNIHVLLLTLKSFVCCVLHFSGNESFMCSFDFLLWWWSVGVFFLLQVSEDISAFYSLVLY